MQAFYFPALLLFLAFAPAAHALQPRADRDDAEYLELASKYAATVKLSTGEVGALINARWVVTTAKAAKALRVAGGKAAVRAGDRDYAVKEAIAHPLWLREGGPNDVGLVLLKDPVRGVEPVAVNRETDESGRGIAIGTIGADGRRRASINTVDAVAPQAFESRVKPLDEASDLQAALGSADLGAPAYFASPEGVTVAGIAFAIDGATERYVRLSSYFSWIEDVMLEVNKREAAELLGN